MKKLLLYLAACLFIGNTCLMAQEDFSLTHYSVRDGLSQNTVSCIYQDGRGYMWFGTFNGLNKFDGYRFRHYKTISDSNKTVTDGRIDHVTEDQFGIIWIITHDGRVFRLDEDTGCFHPVLDTVHEGRNALIREIVPLSSGGMCLLGDGGGCFVVRPGDRAEKADVAYLSQSNSSMPSDKVLTILKGDSGYEYIITSRGLLIMSGDGVMSAAPIPDSYNDINCAFYGNGGLWLGFIGGMVCGFDPESGQFNDTGIGMSSDVTGIVEIGGSMLAITDGEGFVVWKPGGNPRRYDLRRYSAGFSNRLLNVSVDSRGEVWIEMAAPGILHFDPARDEVRVLKQDVDRAGIYVNKDWAFTLEDAGGNMWVYPNGGGFSLYDRERRSLKHFHNDPNDPHSRFSNVIFQAYSDRQGNLWMSTYSRGLEKISFINSPLRNIKPSADSDTSADNEVRAVGQQRNGYVWYACRDGSLYRSDSLMGSMRKLNADGSFGTGRPFNSFVYDIHEDAKGVIWLATRNHGVYTLIPAGRDNYKIRNFRYDPADAYSVSSDMIYSICGDPSGRIWLGTWNGGLNYVSDDGNGNVRFINYRNHLQEYPSNRFTRIRQVRSDAGGNIWAATTQGLVCLRPDGGSGFRAEMYDHIPGDSDSPPANDIHGLEFTGDTVWLATFGAGLCRFIPQGTAPRFTSFNTGNGFPADIILTLVKSGDSQLWMSSENEVIRFDPADGSVEVFDNYVHGSSPDIYFSEGAAALMKDGRMIFGHSNGAYMLYPKGAGKSSNVPEMTLSRLMLFNREAMPLEKDSPLSAELDVTDALRLNHRQSVFSIEYAALDFSNPQAILYAYKLDGFDKDWNYVNGQRTATYTNLPYGKYTFMVRSTNADKVWVDNTRRLAVEIVPPFWKTGWAYLVYALLFAVILYVGSRIFLSFIRLRNEVDVEHRVTEMKLKFFTDISHEIRTPLTLISSPVEHLLESEELPGKVADTLGTVKLNTDRLLRLVNQLLDFRKVQNSKMKLYVEKVAPGMFAREVCRNFEREALERNINFVFSDYSDGEEIWSDQDKLDKILFNLLSNSFKFTPDGGRIGCTVRNDVNQMSIAVSDEGGGIPDDVMNSLFVRFSSSGENTARHSCSSSAGSAGTGIGLSLTKELVDLLGGSIDVDSRMGEGTTITVVFNKGREYFSGLPGCTVREEPEATDAAPEQYIAADAVVAGGDKNTVLFIEDNRELRDFLRSVASREYNVLEAPEGGAGLELARLRQPDIIVSDIMMEGVDGLETVRRLREDISTSHIPVILLTAKSDIGDKLEAMKLGVDDYITKPFSAAYLLARMSNILEQRAKLRGFYTSEAGMTRRGPEGESDPTSELQAGISAADSEFMTRLTGYMDSNLTDPDLKIDNLLAIFNMSYSLLFKKMKSLTGLSPVEYIREFRIKRAAELIRQGEFNIKQITYMVGMNDSRYFSRCFKQTFSMTPTEYRSKYYPASKDTKSGV